MTAELHPRIQELLAFLDRSRDELRVALDTVPPVDRNRRIEAGTWSAAEILQHLAITERRIARLLTREIEAGRAAGLGPERETDSILTRLDVTGITEDPRPRVAPESIRPREPVEAAAAWDAVCQSRDALRAALLSGNGLALGERVQSHPFIGPLNLYQWVLFVGAHESRHARQIARLARSGAR